MNQEIKQKWIAALRSGKYKQGTGQLRNGDTFCCLGVLCDLKTKEFPEQKWDGYHFDSYTSILPYSVVKWADLPSSNPVIKGNYIADYNDGRNALKQHSFQEIADLIEQNL